jgi:hypothetical protein
MLQDLFNSVLGAHLFLEILGLAPMIKHLKYTIQGKNRNTKYTISHNFAFGRNNIFWCLFTFLTKAFKICNSHTNATPKVGVHLGVIGLHPLHFPLFVKVCFTPKHTFGLMGLCTAHLVANPM